MDPITLHFNVWQAGAHQRQSLAVEDPRGTTILSLKKQLFPEALQASKTVRFIACGKILQDSAALESCGLGREAHIHVSISDAQPGSQAQPSPSSSDGSAKSPEAPVARASSDDGTGKASLAGWAFMASFVLFAGTGAALFVALRKRWQFSMHTSQLIFICAAVWVYLLVFHGLPSLFQVLSQLGTSTGSKETSAWGTAMTPAAAPTPGAAVDEAPSTASPPPASSPGLSLMTPTLPPGDATSAVLTQRR